MTPLLDTLFILLFALLTLSDTRVSTQNELVRVELPRVEPDVSEAKGPRAEPRVLRFELRADSSIWVAPGDGVPAAEPRAVESREALDRELAVAAGDALPEEIVIEIRADREAPHGIAVELLQHLRLRGFLSVQWMALGEESGTVLFGAEDGR